jgi:Tfp pilus assembly protein PilX
MIPMRNRPLPQGRGFSCQLVVVLVILVMVGMVEMVTTETRFGMVIERSGGDLIRSVLPPT